MGDAAAAASPRCVGAWRLGAQIGAGSVAVVHRATHGGDGTAAAVKEINTQKLSPKLLDSLAGEVAVLKSASSHAHIVRLLDTVQARAVAAARRRGGAPAAHHARAFVSPRDPALWERQRCVPR